MVKFLARVVSIIGCILVAAFMLAVDLGHHVSIREAWAQATSFGGTPCGTPQTINATTSTANAHVSTNCSVVQVWNIGSTEAFVKTGSTVGTVAATTDESLPAGSFKTYNLGIGGPYVAAITATGSTTIRVSSFNGSPYSGGGGAGGSGGSTTITSPIGQTTMSASVSVAIASDQSAVPTTTTVTSSTPEGALADSTCGTATGTCSIIALLKFLNNAVTSAIPAGTNIIGKVGIDQTTPGTTNLVAITPSQAGVGATGSAVPANANYQAVSVGGTLTGVIGDPCQTVAKTFTPISITTATTTRIVAPTSSKKTYICQITMVVGAADNVALVEGTGGTCGSGTAGVMGGTTAANGWNFAANGGIALGNGGYSIGATAGTNVDLCLITSASTVLAGGITWVAQ